MLKMVHKETAAGLASLTYTGACEVLIREGWLTTLNLPTEFLVDGLRKSKPQLSTLCIIILLNFCCNFEIEEGNFI